LCRDVAWRELAGQPFELGERGVVVRATANSLATDRHGPPQDDQVAKTKLFTASRSRIPDQGLGPT
jgi:hypothetical protein